MTFYVYQIINTINGKIYIGQTNDIKRRWKEHIQDAHKKSRAHKPIYKAIRKYGLENFEFRIIQEVPSFQEALLCEIYWTQYYQTNIIRYGKEFGYNLSDGGNGGGHGPKSKTHRENIGKAHKGKKKSKDFKINLSKIKSTFTIEELTKIKQLLIDGVQQHIIAQMYGVTQAIISDMNIGKSHRYFFTDDDINLFQQRVYDRSGEKNNGAKLKEFQVKEIKSLLRNNISVAIIAKQYGIGKTSVRRIKDGESWAFVE